MAAGPSPDARRRRRGLASPACREPGGRATGLPLRPDASANRGRAITRSGSAMKPTARHRLAAVRDRGRDRASTGALRPSFSCGARCRAPPGRGWASDDRDAHRTGRRRPRRDRRHRDGRHSRCPTSGGWHHQKPPQTFRPGMTIRWRPVSQAPPAGPGAARPPAENCPTDLRSRAPRIGAPAAGRTLGAASHPAAATIPATGDPLRQMKGLRAPPAPPTARGRRTDHRATIAHGSSQGRIASRPPARPRCNLPASRRITAWPTRVPADAYGQSDPHDLRGYLQERRS